MRKPYRYTVRTYSGRTVLHTARFHTYQGARSFAARCSYRHYPTRIRLIPTDRELALAACLVWTIIGAAFAVALS